jgi:hypothetical protein
MTLLSIAALTLWSLLPAGAQIAFVSARDGDAQP